MKPSLRRRRWVAVATVLFCVALVAVWQWQALARLVIVSGFEVFAHMHLSFARAQLTPTRAVFEDMHLTSFQNEPIADVARFEIAYDLRDLLPGGRRLFGLKAVEADSPRVTIIRRSDGTYNVPVPTVHTTPRQGGAPLIVRARVRGGSIEVVDESRFALPENRRLYAENIDVDADVSTKDRSTYDVTLSYGDHKDRLYPVVGRGTIAPAQGYVNQHWTAAHLPIAGAVNFVVNSSSLRIRSGMLQNVDARYFGIGDGIRSPRAHLAAGAMLDDGTIAVAGLSRPVTGVHGTADVYDDGVLTPSLEGNVAGIPATIRGGIYGLSDPRLRVSIRGSGDLAQLRTAFAQGRRLPVRGPLEFSLLVEGGARQPLTWIALRSPQTTYATTTVENVHGALAFDGKEADIVRFAGAYGRVNVSVRGRVTLNKQPNAVEMLILARSPPGGVPYVTTLLPNIPLRAAALATANDPKAIALRGALWGESRDQALDTIFNVDEHGSGTIGPLYARSGRGSLYARIALDRIRGPSAGVLDVRDFPLPAAKGAVTATLVGVKTGSALAVTGDADVAGSWGAATAHGGIGLRNGALSGTIVGNLGSNGGFGAEVRGSPNSPRIAGTVVIAGRRYRDFNLNGNAGLAYANGTLSVHDAAVAIGPLFVTVGGTIQGLSPHGAFAPRYDLAAQLHSSDVSSLVAAVAPEKARLVQGSIDADLRVRGVGATPSLAGSVSAPEGSINGLSFRDFESDVSGDATALALSKGSVIVGSSAISLDANASRAGSADVAVIAPRIDLADFNDFFDTGDTFGGTGSLRLRAHLIGARILSTSGAANFSNARFRRIDLGSVAARWRGETQAIGTSVQFGGSTGEISLNGVVAPATRSVDVSAAARHVDLSTWLPMLGYNLPVTGRLDAQTYLAGSYPDVAMRLHAAISNGTAGRMTLERFEVSASAEHGRGTIASAVLDVPAMATVASGTFGLRGTDALALVVRSTSPNVGEFLRRATGKNFGISGSFDSNLRIEGTRAEPRLRDAIALQSLHFSHLTIPRVAAEIDADRRMVAVRNGEIDLDRGKALLEAAIPVRLTQTGITLGAGAISGSAIAQDIELSNFANLMPKGTQIGGRIDGQVRAAGTVAAPDLIGAVTLANGTFNGPMERSPVTGIAGTLAFAGARAQLQSHAFVGAGRVTASAVASLADLRHPADATFTVDGRATNARLDLPNYFQGDLNGTVAIVRRAAAMPALSGNLSVSNARVPLTAVLSQKASAGGHPGLPNLAFDGLRVTVGQNVRVQSGNVDIGATGALRLGGTLYAPVLAGGFHSTGGSLSFYRSFNIQRGDVTFDPSGGLTPDVDAVATTFVPDPATAIRLHVTGPVTDMNVALASDPPYSRQQILGLLVGAQQFGAVQGVQSTGGGRPSAGSAAQSFAMGQANTVFTRTMLEPLSTSVASALGFSEVQITSDIQTGLGVNAVKALGKFVNAIYSETFGYPRTQSVALEAHPSPAMGLRLSAYSSEGPTLFALDQPQPIGADVLNVNPATSFTPITGSNGVSFSVERKFR